MKSFKEFLEEATANATVKTIAHQTDINDHTGAVMTLAQYLKDYSAINKLKALKAKTDKQGQIYPDQSKMRNQLLDELLAKLPQSEFKKFHNAF